MFWALHHSFHQSDRLCKWNAVACCAPKPIWRIGAAPCCLQSLNGCPLDCAYLAAAGSFDLIRPLKKSRLLPSGDSEYRSP